jgi:hypothetical protein
MISRAIASGLLVALLAALGLAGVQTWRLSRAEVEIAKGTATLATERAAAAEAARAAEAKHRSLEQQLVAKTAENDYALYKARAERAATLARERADHERLRDDIEAFLTSGVGGAETCAAELDLERYRSATLGKLFTDADRVAGEMADAAERHADEARALKRQVLIDRNITGPQQ